jgi:hypothetical protein
MRPLGSATSLSISAPQLRKLLRDWPVLLSGTEFSSLRIGRLQSEHSF